jgi:hypothetical protein
LTSDEWLAQPHVPGAATKSHGDTKMKTLVTRMVLLATMAVAPLFTSGAAYAQRYREAPQAYGDVDHSYNSQRTVDEITNNDWNAGK